jgi:hypothetical protein
VDQDVFVNAPSWAEPFEHIVLGVASIIGGLWVLLRLIQERLWDSALDIVIRSSMIPTEIHPLSFLEVRLTNRGKVQLRAKVRRTRGLAFKNEAEQIKYSCSLQLKKISPRVVNADAWINWFDDNSFEATQLVEIDLLNEYEDRTEVTEPIFGWSRARSINSAFRWRSPAAFTWPK